MINEVTHSVMNSEIDALLDDMAEEFAQQIAISDPVRLLGVQ